LAFDSATRQVIYYKCKQNSPSLSCPGLSLIRAHLRVIGISEEADHVIPVQTGIQVRVMFPPPSDSLPPGDRIGGFLLPLIREWDPFVTLCHCDKAVGAVREPPSDEAISVMTLREAPLQPRLARASGCSRYRQDRGIARHCCLDLSLPPYKPSISPLHSADSPCSP